MGAFGKQRSWHHGAIAGGLRRDQAAAWCIGGGAVSVLLPCLWWWHRVSNGAVMDAAAVLRLAVPSCIGLALLLCGFVLLRHAATGRADPDPDPDADLGADRDRDRERREREVAERALDERSRLLSSVAQDLRQPLYAMSLTTRSLQRPWAFRNTAPLIAQLRTAIASADALLDALDTMAQLENGSLQPRLTVFSVQGMLERLEQQHGAQARARGLRWTVTPSLEQVRTDASLLERMLDHVVANAVRTTESGGVLVSCRRRGPCLLIQVWDTGPGFEETPSPPTERAVGPTAQALVDAEGGAGRGLPVLRRAARVLGIGLDVRSRPGHGTCIGLLVPLVDAGPERPGAT